VALLVDTSDSLGGSALDVARDLELSELRERPSLFYFGADTTLVDELEGDIPDFLDTTQTDLARALQVAQASGAKRTLLVSDGAQSVGDALLALPDTPVDTFYQRSRENVRLVSLLAPEQVSPGETAEVIAVVESDQAGTVTLRPSAGGVALDPIEATVTAGRTPISFSFQAEDSDSLRVSAAIETSFEQPLSDDAQQVDIAVSRRSPVLVINDPAFAQLLSAQGFDVQIGNPADITAPLNYSAIIVRQGSGEFTNGQLELLNSYVTNGGGLMMTGGPASFGFGAWYRTPVEDVLPVNTDLRTEVELPLVALVIVMDRSQSMSTGNPSKIDLAKEGAISVVDLAYQDDLLGLIVFSDSASTDWAFNLRRATDQGKREMLSSILAIDTQGGTVLEPAYREALDELTNTEAAIKHVIILSDGKLYDGGGVFGAQGTDVNFSTIAQDALQAGITTSTIAIGQGADFQRLESVALSGGGRYYEALDVSTLPKIFTNEALTATRSLLREETFAPDLRANPLAPTGVTPPSLNAYIATTLKSDSEVLLDGLQSEPVLAVSRQGLGRSAALTTDLNAWAGDLGNWNELPGLLGTVTRWLQTRPADFAATVDRQGTELHVVVDAVRDGEYVNGQDLEVRYGGDSVALEQIAPGRYEGYVPATSANAASGGTLLVVDGDEIVARNQVNAPNAEFDTATGEALLRTIAERTGGEFYTSLETYAPTTPDDTTPLWPWPALIGLLVFLLELAVRRLGPVGTRQLAAGD